MKLKTTDDAYKAVIVIVETMHNLFEIGAVSKIEGLILTVMMEHTADLIDARVKALKEETSIMDHIEKDIAR